MLSENGLTLSPLSRFRGKLSWKLRQCQIPGEKSPCNEEWRTAVRDRVAGTALPANC
jgi:hypothetical protein